jgi:hypothetical protein
MIRGGPVGDTQSKTGLSQLKYFVSNKSLFVPKIPVDFGLIRVGLIVDPGFPEILTFLPRN